MIDKRARFYKTGDAKYISHLDLYRFMLRAIKRADLPIWYTEGFNPHAYISFPAPLSLGQEGKNEAFDFRILTEMTDREIIERLNSALPKDIRVTRVSDPVHSAKKIAYAEYQLTFSISETTPDFINSIVSSADITVTKKSKSGVKQINLAEYIFKPVVTQNENSVILNLYLPQNNNLAINPKLLVDFIQSKNFDIGYVDISRTDFYTADWESFK